MIVISDEFIKYLKEFPWILKVFIDKSIIIIGLTVSKGICTLAAQSVKVKFTF